MQELRRFHRVPVRIEGTIYLRGEAMPWPVEVMDLTPEGAKIRMSAPFRAKGLMFDLTFTAMGEMVSVTGKIVNLISKDSFGVEFTDVSKFAYVHICAYLYYRMQVLNFRPDKNEP